MKTVLITGCSSGFGLETARYFLERDWKVIATMRRPDNSLLPRSDHLRVLGLDVTDAESIRAAVEAAGPIDALVNNAGIGMLGVFETTPMAITRDLFETNTFGTFALIQAVLPQMRARKAGVVVNVTSSVTLKPLPLLSVYTASKAAVTAFTESLALELQPLNIRVAVVEPGRSPTRFAENARPRMQGDVPDAYTDFVGNVFAGMGPSAGTEPLDVAQAVWRAVKDPASPMRMPAGADAIEMAQGS
ncbi:SDR family oxidoreductase [Hoeflea sp. G2-23]|uniref:SDR family oxidoreductase n=1 Tax=Hoeflea algicola TaxID=2983763 RepID=A0ABT3Z7J6_9HYPH|nr:SDR family oxidoreductase [Hoeflea algicola]MCY0147618.1 SDR family oxidoreductase [Hoeflea algicola]